MVGASVAERVGVVVCMVDVRRDGFVAVESEAGRGLGGRRTCRGGGGGDIVSVLKGVSNGRRCSSGCEGEREASG